MCGALHMHHQHEQIHMAALQAVGENVVSVPFPLSC